LGIRELSSPFQTELAIDTNIAVADTHTMVKDIRQNMLASQESASRQSHSVGVICYP
jgi:hypothetical protein